MFKGDVSVGGLHRRTTRRPRRTRQLMANDPGTPSQTRADRLMRLVWPTPPPDLPEQTRRRVILYLIPYLFFLYILAYIDRVNVAVTALGMEKSPAEDGLGFDAR